MFVLFHVVQHLIPIGKQQQQLFLLVDISTVISHAGLFTRFLLLNYSLNVGLFLLCLAVDSRLDGTACYIVVAQSPCYALVYRIVVTRPSASHAIAHNHAISSIEAL